MNHHSSDVYIPEKKHRLMVKFMLSHHFFTAESRVFWTQASALPSGAQLSLPGKTWPGTGHVALVPETCLVNPNLM